MKYRTGKAKELYEQLLRLREEKKAAIEKSNKVWNEARRLEYEHATLVASDYIAMGCSPIDHIWANPEEKKADRERTYAYLKANNWECNWDIEADYNEKIAEARTAFNLEQYGYPTKKEYLEVKYGVYEI